MMLGMLNHIFLLTAIAIAFFAFVWLLILVRRHGRNQHDARKVIALSCVTLLCLALVIFLVMAGSPGPESLRENELKYSQAAAVVLGRRLARMFEDAGALIIATDNYGENPRQAAIISGLKEGFEEKITVHAIRSPEKRGVTQMESDREAEHSEKPKPYLEHRPRKGGEFRRIVDSYPTCRLVISLVDMPQDALKSDDKKKPLVVLVFPSQARRLEHELRTGSLWVLTSKPDVPLTKGLCPEDPQHAFNQRFIILNQRNVESFGRKHKDFFQP
jgi:hypothetical protein